MLGWRLFIRAVTLIADNLPAALRISAVPYAVVVALDLWIETRWPGAAVRALEMAGPVETGFAMASILSMGVSVAVSLWIAVAWHRYTLRGELAPGWVPPFRVPLVWQYLIRMMGIGLIVMAAVLISGMFVAPLAVVVGQQVVAQLIPIVGLFVGMTLFYRFGLMLPAAALGKEMTFGEAWDASHAKTGAIAALALLSVAVAHLIQLPVQIDGAGGMIGVVYGVVTGWIGLMLSVGILTALYGHLIEGRAID